MTAPAARTGSRAIGNAAYRLNRTIFYTDFDYYLTAGAAPSPVPNTGGPIRTEAKRPNNIRFTAAIQRELGKNIVVDAAYVGNRTRYLQRDENINQIPYLRRFDPAYRDPTMTPTPSNPGALPDAYLRPIAGYSDINIFQTIGWQNYDSLQMQVTRRFTGRFEMAGSYTWARGTEDRNYTGNPLPTITERRDLQEHVLVASYQYEIPRASALFNDNKVVGYILDNWRISGISTFGTGGRGDIDTVTYSPASSSPAAERAAATSRSSAIRSCRAAIGISIAGSTPRRSRRCRDEATTTPTATGGDS